VALIYIGVTCEKHTTLGEMQQHTLVQVWEQREVRLLKARL